MVSLLAGWENLSNIELLQSTPESIRLFVLAIRSDLFLATEISPDTVGQSGLQILALEAD